MKKMSIVTALAAVFIAVLAVGCASAPKGPKVAQYDIVVDLDESLKNSSVIVDLVGANQSSLPRWEAYDMGKYWKDGDTMRRDADKKVLNFVPSSASLSQSLSASDPKWQQWKAQGVTHVVVLIDLPGAQASKSGVQDPRRQILSLDRNAWAKGTKELKLLVRRSGAMVVTPAAGMQ